MARIPTQDPIDAPDSNEKEELARQAQQGIVSPLDEVPTGDEAVTNPNIVNR